MGLFSRNKTAKKSDPIPQPAAAPSKEEVEAEMRDLLSNQSKVSAMIGKPIKTSNSPSDDELLRELEELERQYGSSRGGDRVAALRQMIKNTIWMIRELNKEQPRSAQTIEAQERLLASARRLHAELQSLTNKGGKRKKSTRRRRVRRSS
jgi:hypothetical protein